MSALARSVLAARLIPTLRELRDALRSEPRVGANPLVSHGSVLTVLNLSDQEQEHALDRAGAGDGVGASSAGPEVLAGWKEPVLTAGSLRLAAGAVAVVRI